MIGNAKQRLSQKGSLTITINTTQLWPQFMIAVLRDDRIGSWCMATQFPIVVRAQVAPLKLVWPNGRTVAVHDSWPKETYPTTYASGPMLLNHYGHARLLITG